MMNGLNNNGVVDGMGRISDDIDRSNNDSDLARRIPATKVALITDVTDRQLDPLTFPLLPDPSQYGSIGKGCCLD